VIRRELAIVLGVLVPSGVLLALAFLGFGEEPPSSLPVSAPPSPRPAPTPVRLPPAATVLISTDAGEPVVTRQPFPKELAAPLAAVTPEVMLCFHDERAHHHETQHLKVHFTPTRDGGFSAVKVPTTPNPWVSACVEDVFDEMRFVPTGAETFQPATFDFVFDPSHD
jgi:hypothetical protein